MRKMIVVGIVLSLCAAGVFAQTVTKSSDAVGLEERSMDVFPSGFEPRTEPVYSTELEAATKKAGVTEETVGDPYSFGRKVVFLGVAQTDSVDLQEDCSAYPPDFGRCVETAPAPGPTSVYETDLAVIELPGKSTKSILCFTITPFSTWEWFNPTASQQTAQMFLRPVLRIESDVLLDPSLINPNTGLPFNGVLFDNPISTFLQARSLDPNEYEFQSHRMTRSCTGGLVNEGALRDGYGLSNSVIKNFFKNPITVSFGVSGTVQMVTNASYFVGVRLYGDK